MTMPSMVTASAQQTGTPPDAEIASSLSELNAWFERYRARRLETFVLPHGYYKWRRTSRDTTSDSDLTAMAERVRTKKGSREEQELQRIYAARAGKIASINQVWMDSNGWRLSTELDKSPVPSFFDHGVRNDIEWDLTPDSLRLKPGGDAPSRDRFDARPHLQSIVNEIEPLWRTGFDVLGDATISGSPQFVDSSHWRLNGTAVSKYAKWDVTFLGEWETASASGTVRAVDLTRKNSAARVKLEFARPEIDVGDGQKIAKSFRLVTPEIAFDVDLVEVRQLREGEFASVTKAPSPGESDVVRGDIATLKSVEDSRTGSTVVSRVVSGDVIDSVVRGKDPESDRRHSLLVAGWIGGAVVVTTVVCLRVRSVRNVDAGKD